MINVGEQLVASYLQYIRECEFTQMNLYTIDSQGEIDVVGDLPPVAVPIIRQEVRLQG
jgi:hypothetical protein